MNMTCDDSVTGNSDGPCFCTTSEWIWLEEMSMWMSRKAQIEINSEV